MELLKLKKTIKEFYDKKELDITKFYILYRISLYGDLENGEKIPYETFIKDIPKAISYFEEYEEYEICNELLFFDLNFKKFKSIEDFLKFKKRIKVINNIL